MDDDKEKHTFFFPWLSQSGVTFENRNDGDKFAWFINEFNDVNMSKRERRRLKNALESISDA